MPNTVSNPYEDTFEINITDAFINRHMTTTTDCSASIHGEFVKCKNTFVKCKKCKKRYNLLDGFNVFGKDAHVCINCFKIHYICCQFCERIKTKNKAVKFPDFYVCAKCYASRQIGLKKYPYHDNEYPLHEYNHSPKPYYHLKASEVPNKWQTKFPYYGIEIEVTRPRCNRIARFQLEDDLSRLPNENESDFYLKRDGSIRNGLEIVTHPRTLQSHLDYDYQAIFKLIRKHGFSAQNRKCGLHVHVSRRFLTYTEQVKLAFFVHKFKAKIKKLARRSSKRYSPYKNIKEHSKMALAYSAHKYDALNFFNYDTIEFRMFAGTDDVNEMLITLEFIDSLIHYIKTTIQSDYIGQRMWKKYLLYINADKIKYDELLRYCQEKRIWQK